MAGVDGCGLQWAADVSDVGFFVPHQEPITVDAEARVFAVGVLACWDCLVPQAVG